MKQLPTKQILIMVCDMYGGPSCMATRHRKVEKYLPASDRYFSTIFSHFWPHGPQNRERRSRP